MVNNSIFEYKLLILINRSGCLVRFKYINIKNTVNLP